MGDVMLVFLDDGVASPESPFGYTRCFLLYFGESCLTVFLSGFRWHHMA